MKKEDIKLGMKVWYKDDEWEVHKIYENIEVVTLLKNEKCLGKYQEIRTFAKFEDLKPIDECQTSTTIPTYNFDEEELVEEWSKTSLPAIILKKIFNLFK